MELLTGTDCQERERERDKRRSKTSISIDSDKSLTGHSDGCERARYRKDRRFKKRK